VGNSNNVGIGTSSPDALLRVNGTTKIGEGVASNTAKLMVNTGAGVAAGIQFFQDATESWIIQNPASTTALTFANSGTERMRIDASGNVGIGSTDAASYGKFLVNGTGNLINANASSGAATFQLYEAGSGRFGITTLDGSAGAKFTTAGTERMRIDSSGNLLVGKTASDLGATAGIELNGQYDVGYFTRSGDKPLVVNRLSSDGAIADFRKDGTTVGSIGSVSGLISYINLDPRSGGTGISGTNTDSIIPVTGTGASANGTKDLGLTTARWRDLYLSGGVYLGGTGAANLLDDYEEGTWTPTYQGATTAGTGTYTFQHGSYTKVGNLVTINGYFRSTAHTGTGNIELTGLPFTVASGAGNYGVINVGETINLTISNDTYLTGYANPGTTTIILRQISTQNPTSTAFINMDTGFDLLFTVTYRTA
jgi:hypothetical protein